MFELEDKLEVTWPQTADEILALGKRILSTLRQLPSDQIPDGRLVKNLRSGQTELETAVIATKSAAFYQITTNEAYQEAVQRGKPLINEAIDRLCDRYANNLPRLSHWGLPARLDPHGRMVIFKPETREEIETFLKAYLYREESLTPEQRLEDPDLEEMLVLGVMLAQYKELCRHAQTDQVTIARQQEEIANHYKMQLQTAVSTCSQALPMVKQQQCYNNLGLT